VLYNARLLQPCSKTLPTNGERCSVAFLDETDTLPWPVRVAVVARDGKPTGKETKEQRKEKKKKKTHTHTRSILTLFGVRGSASCASHPFIHPSIHRSKPLSGWRHKISLELETKQTVHSAGFVSGLANVNEPRDLVRRLQTHWGRQNRLPRPSKIRGKASTSPGSGQTRVEHCVASPGGMQDIDSLSRASSSTTI
jgi:hypothetical protein